MIQQTKPRRGCPGSLNDEQVREIRRLYDAGNAYKTYANELGASDAMARLIARRKSYVHVPGLTEASHAGG